MSKGKHKGLADNIQDPRKVLATGYDLIWHRARRHVVASVEQQVDAGEATNAWIQVRVALRRSLRHPVPLRQQLREDLM